MTPPRLLIVTPTLDTGGAERQVTHLAIGLAELGHPVSICCVDEIAADTAELARAGVPVVELGGRSPSTRARALPRLTALARRADVVIASNWDATFWGRVAAAVARRPAIAIEHAVYREQQISRRGKPRARLIAWHNRVLDPLTYATVACADAQRAVLLAEGVDGRKIVRIPNGVPLGALREAAARGATRAALGIPADARVLVHVARLTRLKNQRQTLATARALRARLGADVHVLLVGPGEDQAALERETADEPWAHVLGGRDDVPALLALADLAVLPSLAEAMPMAIAEAFALGVPVVGSDVGDVGRVLRASGGGIAVAPGDGDAFTDACARLLGDEAARRRCAAAAAAAAADFDAGTMARRYARLADAALRGVAPDRVALDQLAAA